MDEQKVGMWEMGSRSISRGSVKSNPRERFCPFSVQPDLAIVLAPSPAGCPEPLGAMC